MISSTTVLDLEAGERAGHLRVLKIRVKMLYTLFPHEPHRVVEREGRRVIVFCLHDDLHTVNSWFGACANHLVGGLTSCAPLDAISAIASFTSFVAGSNQRGSSSPPLYLRLPCPADFARMAKAGITYRYLSVSMPCPRSTCRYIP